LEETPKYVREKANEKPLRHGFAMPPLLRRRGFDREKNFLFLPEAPPIRGTGERKKIKYPKLWT
jgi:hypothetical protein